MKRILIVSLGFWALSLNANEGTFMYHPQKATIQPISAEQSVNTRDKPKGCYIY